jgi:cell division protease FtsH
MTRILQRRMIGLAAAAVLLLAGWLAMDRFMESPTPERASYTALLAAIDNGEVKALKIEPERRITAARRDGAPPLRVVFPLSADPDLMGRAAAAGVEVEMARVRDLGAMANLIFAFLMIGALLVVVRLVLREQYGGSAEAGVSTTTFAHVAGASEVVGEVREVVDFLRRPETFVALGARTPRGVLLSGPPGTGKTLIARAVAGEAGVPFYSLSGSAVTGFIVGLGAHRIRAAFKKARRSGGVIFIDEIDALGGTRGRNSSHNEDDRSLNQLLVEMDGFTARDGVIVIGATNRPDVLDPALTRPGRFDRLLTVPLPTSTERQDILRLHVDKRGIPLADDVDLGRLARLLPNSSGADLENLLNEAAIAAGRRDAAEVRWSDIETARDRLLLGGERPGFRVSDAEWRLVAYHEAGHAIAGLRFCPEDGLHKVTIQPRGRSLGVAHFEPKDDVALHSRRYLRGQLVKLLAGRAAEEIIAGPDGVTSGAESDLTHANRIARRMVMRLGMGADANLLIADTDFPLSEGAQERMEAAVGALLGESMDSARRLLADQEAALHALADALMEHETLAGDEVRGVLEVAGFEIAEVREEAMA